MNFFYTLTLALEFRLSYPFPLSLSLFLSVPVSVSLCSCLTVSLVNAWRWKKTNARKKKMRMGKKDKKLLQTSWETRKHTGKLLRKITDSVWSDIVWSLSSEERSEEKNWLRKKKKRQARISTKKKEEEEECTVGQNNHESRFKYWVTRSFIHSFAGAAQSFASSTLLTLLACSAALICSLASLTHSLLSLWESKWLDVSK